MGHYWVLCYLTLLHFVGDFLLQSRQMGTKKSSEPKWLIAHVGIYTLTLMFGCVWLWETLPLSFFLFVGLIHAVQDWYIWRGYKWLVGKLHPEATVETFEYWNDKWFYSTIGLDQMLHMVTILVMYGLYTG